MEQPTISWRIAVLAFRALVPPDNDAIRSDSYDGVIREFDDGSQAQLLLLAGFLLGDVFSDTGKAADDPLVTSYRIVSRPDPPHLAIGSDDAELLVITLGRALAGDGVLHLDAVVLVDGVYERPGILDEALAGAAPDRFVGGADITNGLVRTVSDPEHLLEVGHQLPELFGVFRSTLDEKFARGVGIEWFVISSGPRFSVAHNDLLIRKSPIRRVGDAEPTRTAVLAHLIRLVYQPMPNASRLTE